MAKLTFDDYQSMAGETAIYPNQGELEGLMYVGLGLGGEAGEVQGKIKKLHRDGGYGDPEKMENIADELGDVLWYIANVASELGQDLNSIAERNLNKLQSRKERGVLGGSGDNR